MDDTQIQTCLEMLASNPTVLSAILQLHAERSVGGVYFSAGECADEGPVGVVLATDLSQDKAEKLFDFLSELTEGATPDWNSHKVEMALAESVSLTSPGVA